MRIKFGGKCVGERPGALDLALPLASDLPHSLALERPGLNA